MLLFLHCNFFTISKARHTGNHHLVAIIDTRDNLVFLAEMFAKFHLLISHLTILIYIYVAVAGTNLLHQCYVRDNDMILLAKVNDSTTEHTRTNLSVVIGYGNLNREGVS